MELVAELLKKGVRLLEQSLAERFERRVVLEFGGFANDVAEPLDGVDGHLLAILSPRLLFDGEPGGLFGPFFLPSGEFLGLDREFALLDRRGFGHHGAVSLFGGDDCQGDTDRGGRKHQTGERTSGQ